MFTLLYNSYLVIWFTRGEGGVKTGQNLVHVVCERPLVLLKLILPLLILALIFSMSDSRSFCLFKAFTASGPVTATILRIPLAMASSDAMMKGPM